MTITIFFNTKFLEEKQHKCGSLKCVYCGQPDLVIYHWQDPNKKRANMATTDHFNPKDNGGGAFDKKNMVVSCYKCNRNKDAHLWHVDTLVHIDHYGDPVLLKKQLSYPNMPEHINRYGFSSVIKLEEDFYHHFDQICDHLEHNKKRVGERKRQWLSLIKVNRLTCPETGKEAAYLSYDRKPLKHGRSSFHWNFYTADGDLLTIDHIHPKSKGGSHMNVSNLQVMVAENNWKKSNKI